MRRSCRTVASPATQANGAAAASKIDLTDHPLAAESYRSLFDRADKLVPQHAAEGHVTICDLQVGVADAGEMHTYDDHLRARYRWTVIDDT